MFSLQSINMGKYRRADLKALGAVPEWYVSACIRFPFLWLQRKCTGGCIVSMYICVPNFKIDTLFEMLAFIGQNMLYC